MKKALFNFCILFAFLGLDAAIKALVLHEVPHLQGGAYPFGGIGIFDFGGIHFSINTVFNTGAAWGVFPDHFWILLFFRICMVAGIVGYLLFFRSGPMHWPLWLIATGAFGNILDMFIYGRVIDFFHLQFFGWSFPVFNIADSCITAGVLLLLLWPHRWRACHAN